MFVIAMFRYVQVYNQIRENIAQADATADLKWWSVNRGPEMKVSWPSYEVCVIFVSAASRVYMLLFSDHNVLTRVFA